MRTRISVIPCTPTTATEEDACARSVVSSFARRAFRRPLDDDEASRMFALFAKRRDAEGFDMGLRALLEAILQAPQFLYRVELGEGVAVDSEVALSNHEVATRLSYFLW